MEQAIDADLLRIPVGPGSLHVERYGHGGGAVVLLHGFGTSSFLWRNIAPALTFAGLTAFAVDLLGYGESDRPLDADYSIAAQAEYLERAMTGLRVPEATVVGLGIGGGIALRLACTRPARVRRLALINSVAFDDCPGRDVRSIQLGTARFALRVSQGVLGAAPLLKRVLEEGVAHREAMPARLVARYLAPYAGADGVMHLLALARALRAEDVESLPLSRLAVPTLILWGEEEPWLDSGLPERLQRAIPGSTLVRMAQVGRLVPEDSPELLAQLLSEHARGGEPGQR
ncbi:MAG TPA: alpha/beta fold hydrolase [Gemmatimonadaceae bacterium]